MRLRAPPAPRASILVVVAGILAASSVVAAVPATTQAPPTVLASGNVDDDPRSLVQCETWWCWPIPSGCHETFSPYIGGRPVNDRVNDFRVAVEIAASTGEAVLVVQQGLVEEDWDDWKPAPCAPHVFTYPPGSCTGGTRSNVTCEGPAGTMTLATDGHFAWGPVQGRLARVDLPAL